MHSLEYSLNAVEGIQSGPSAKRSPGSPGITNELTRPSADPSCSACSPKQEANHLQSLMMSTSAQEISLAACHAAKKPACWLRVCALGTSRARCF